ncbi:MAG TPA: leucine--tRNA ligase, partial [Planctomycetota bacterium]|nr:leucine--tRNA ligase [Planctomycetota bacterium]
MPEYNFREIETKWQRVWDQQQRFKAVLRAGKPKCYVLCMYPYPSGALHMGHVINYTIGDVIVRYRMMKGFNVLSPMGWDSFGLPAENAAIKGGMHPEESTNGNIAKMRAQMHRAGWAYDWSREIATSHPGYYKWTQWLFLQFYKAGQAFKKRAGVNWCPKDNTVLANEQVQDGRCERCGTVVKQRDLEQWFFKMSSDAERLLRNHEQLKGWPERVLKMQAEWIGRSEGARIDFTITETGDPLPVFTTRPDTVYGVTFMSIAPEHPLVDKLMKGHPREQEVMSAVREMQRGGTAERERVDMEKIGIATGFHVTNPLNGDEVPLYVANFALMTYGTGAVMSVPAHDQRDFEFARKYGLPIKIVIQPPDGTLDGKLAHAYEGDGVQMNSGPFNGLPNREAMTKIVRHLEKNGWGQGTVNYRLRDWLLSRQRYWGAPIPIVYCKTCGEMPVPEKDLPVLLPRNVEFKPTGESPLARCPEFVNTTCPQCGGPARRETDTMDTFVDSSWYFLRYLSPRDDRKALDPEAIRSWMPVDQYIGGIEHATMHLIYCRYFTHVLHDLGLVPLEEPIANLFCQGMVCKEAFYCEEDKWLREDEVAEGRCKKCGKPVHAEVAKMSKSRLNVVSPDDIMHRLGADTLRLYILSDTPPERDQLWNDEGLMGAHRFLNRLWSTVQDNLPVIRSAGPVGGVKLDKAARD